MTGTLDWSADGSVVVEASLALRKPQTLLGVILPAAESPGPPVLSNAETIGIVTSGAPSPTLGKSIGLAYVSPGHEAVGTRIDISIRGRATPARIVDTPFVKAARPGA